MEYSNRKERRKMLRTKKKLSIKEWMNGVKNNIKDGKSAMQRNAEILENSLHENREIANGNYINWLKDNGYSDNDITEIMKAKNLLNSKNRKNIKIARNILKNIKNKINDKNNIEQGS